MSRLILHLVENLALHVFNMHLPPGKRSVYTQGLYILDFESNELEEAASNGICRICKQEGASTAS